MLRLARWPTTNRLYIANIEGAATHLSPAEEARFVALSPEEPVPAGTCGRTEG